MGHYDVMPGATFGSGPKPPEKPKTVLPDRLAIDPASPFYNKALLDRGVGVRFKGTEKRNVAEYCISEGWVRLQTQSSARDRLGRPLTVKLQGAVEVWMRDEVQS